MTENSIPIEIICPTANPHDLTVSINGEDMTRFVRAIRVDHDADSPVLVHVTFVKVRLTAKVKALLSATKEGNEEPVVVPADWEFDDKFDQMANV